MNKDLPPSRVAEQFVVRFPDGMRDRIAEAAKASGRSMNAEIVSRLQSTFKPEQVKLDFGPANREADEDSRPVSKRELLQLLNEFVASNDGEVTFKTKVVPEKKYLRHIEDQGDQQPIVNKVILVGNLGRDQEARYLPSVAPVSVQNAPAPKKSTKRPPKVIGPVGQ